MAARSAAELLPRAFAELTIDDLATIIAAVGEERESLFFERKQSITSASLAKSCAAFANTYGGLLIVGVADDSDELVGIDLVAEPQVWVKDVLRGHVLPLPPFRARSLPLPDSTARGVLLVLLEESSTTPHLLTRTGAIYVRNPGSSDPVPINDQKRLLDLTERGKASLAKAEARITEIGRQASFDLLPATQQTELLLLRPTGIAPWFAALLFDSPSPEPLHGALASMDA